MTKTVQAASTTTKTHDGNDLNLKVEQGDAGLENAQQPMMLIEPASLESGFTHSQNEPTMPGKTKAPKVTAMKKKPVKANGAPAQSLKDEQMQPGGKLAEIDNDVDPSAGYLDKEAGMPVINNASTDEETEIEDAEAPEGSGADEFMEDDEADPLAASTEFDDLPSLNASELDDDEFDEVGIDDPAPPAPDVEADMAGEPNSAPTEECADFEAEVPTDEQMPLVDVDDVDDKEGSDNIAFASIGAAVHVIRSNRIIASMGPASARKLNLSNVYLSEQYQDVVAHAIDTKGLRKGLVQQGFTLARVTLSASKATSRVVQAKVEAGMKAKHEAIAKQNSAMEQSLAIAAVGINKRYFKDAPNPLKASLIEELKRSGVRGAEKLIATAFADHGVEYAKSILTLAQRIAAMPEEVRDNHAEALDMTSDEDYVDEAPDEIDGEVDGDETADEFEDMGAPASVTAALESSAPRRMSQSGGRVYAGVQDVARVNSLLFGNQSLVG
jgi:hypothetical protein